MRYILLVIIGISLSMIFTSCRMDHPDPMPQEPNHSIHLNIGHSLESLDEENHPLTLTKGGSSDIYAVQIYNKTGSSFRKYAYGIFDDHTQMDIELEADVFYKIEMTMVSNGVTIISNDNSGYQSPFIIGGDSNTPGKITNKFTLSKFAFMEGLNYGSAMITQQDVNPQVVYNIPPISRFYGITEEFKPDSDTNITINLKWVVFGLTITTENFNEGSIDIEMLEAPKLTITPENHDAITEKIFTFKGNKTSDWCNVDYSENIPTTITWNKADGTSVELLNLSNPINFKRRWNKVINVHCRSNEAENKLLSISKENQTLIGDH